MFAKILDTCNKLNISKPFCQMQIYFAKQTFLVQIFLRYFNAAAAVQSSLKAHFLRTLLPNQITTSVSNKYCTLKSKLSILYSSFSILYFLVSIQFNSTQLNKHKLSRQIQLNSKTSFCPLVLWSNSQLKSNLNL